MPPRAPAISVDVKTSGFFFTGNPVGRLHKNMYDVLNEEGRFGVEAVQQQLQPGHGYYTGQLHDSVKARPQKMRRGQNPSGRLVVLQGTQGYELVRRYGRRIEQGWGTFKGLHHFRNAHNSTKAHVAGRSGEIAADLIRGLNE